MLHAVQEGEVRALEEFYRAHAPVVYRVCLRMAGNSHDAEDWTHDVILKAFDKRHTFRGDASLVTWVYRCAYRYCLRALKRKRPQSLTSGTAIVDGAPGPEGQLERDERRAGIRRAIEQLPPPWQACLALREWERLSYREIAQVIGVPMGTVMTWLHRARSRLLEIVEIDRG